MKGDAAKKVSTRFRRSDGISHQLNMIVHLAA
jgi:hypothetical protein